MKHTENYALPQIELDDYYDIDVFNDGYRKIDEELKNVNESLDNAMGDMKKLTRKFKPLVKCTPEFVTNIKNSNYLQLRPIEDCKRKIDNAKELCVDGLIWVAHLTTKNGVLEAYENVELFLELREYAENIGLTFSAIKFHTVEDTYITPYGKDKFFQDYLTLINDFIEVDNGSIEHITVCNECADVYYSEDYRSSLTAIMEHIKTRGYNVGITTTSNDQSYASQPVNSWVYDASTMIYCNFYPTISNKMELTTPENGVNGVNAGLRRPLIPKTHYNKPMIASECGVKDAWICLTGPASWQLNGTPSNGEVPYIYWYGVFNSECYKHFNEIWTWYDAYLNVPKVKELFNYYLGGE